MKSSDALAGVGVLTGADGTRAEARTMRMVVNDRASRRRRTAVSRRTSQRTRTENPREARLTGVPTSQEDDWKDPDAAAEESERRSARL